MLETLVLAVDDDETFVLLVPFVLVLVVLLRSTPRSPHGDRSRLLRILYLSKLLR